MIRVINIRNEPLGDAVYIGRMNPRRGLPASPFANPFRIGRDGPRGAVIEKYRVYFWQRPELIARARSELRGKTLACWCAPLPCHGDILLAVANREET